MSHPSQRCVEGVALLTAGRSGMSHPDPETCAAFPLSMQVSVWNFLSCCCTLGAAEGSGSLIGSGKYRAK